MAGATIATEGDPTGPLQVLIEGSFSVTRAGVPAASITEPGAMIGEISMLLGTEAGATVTANQDSRIYVIEQPKAFIEANPAAMDEIARVLALRLSRLTAVLADVITQYGDSAGNLGLLGDVLGALSVSGGDAVEPGSKRDPDPAY